MCRRSDQARLTVQAAAISSTNSGLHLRLATKSEFWQGEGIPIHIANRPFTSAVVFGWRAVPSGRGWAARATNGERLRSCERQHIKCWSGSGRRTPNSNQPELRRPSAILHETIRSGPVANAAPVTVPAARILALPAPARSRGSKSSSKPSTKLIRVRCPPPLCSGANERKPTANFSRLLQGASDCTYIPATTPRKLEVGFAQRRPAIRRTLCRLGPR